jgi:hypothetical protein
MRQLRKEAGKPVFTFDGDDIPCIANEATSSKILGEGGFALEADLVLFVEVADLPDPAPQEKQILVYKSKSYRIDHIGALPGDAQIKLSCNSPTRGI